MEGSKTFHTDLYSLEDEFIPPTWVLTVRKCSCGQTLFWDKKKEEWHCMKETCPLYKSHLGEFNVTDKTVNFIKENMDILTQFEIAHKLSISPYTVRKVIRYYKEIEGKNELEK